MVPQFYSAECKRIFARIYPEIDSILMFLSRDNVNWSAIIKKKE
jgi:hypothetical protein